MVTLNKYMDRPQRSYVELYGLSTDEKPESVFNGSAIGNASTFYEMDTKKLYIYDEENHRWYEI